MIAEPDRLYVFDLGGTGNPRGIFTVPLPNYSPVSHFPMSANLSALAETSDRRLIFSTATLTNPQRITFRVGEPASATVLWDGTMTNPTGNGGGNMPTSLSTYSKDGHADVPLWGSGSGFAHWDTGQNAPVAMTATANSAWSIAPVGPSQGRKFLFSGGVFVAAGNVSRTR